MSDEGVTEPDSNSSWSRRPILAFALRAAVFMAPVALAVGAVFMLARVMPRPTTLGPTVLWWAVIVGAGSVVLIGVDKLARRLLPLQMLLTLSLVFPDQAPSRYRIARSVTSRSDVDRALAESAHLADDDVDPGEAATLVLSLLASLAHHDKSTRGHAERTRIVAEMLGEELHLGERSRERLRWAALLHDIGKLHVHAGILGKPDTPDDGEWEELRRHPIEGARITKPLVPWLGPWASAIAEHHERFDGTGYPEGLEADGISYPARIVAVADAFETMTAPRPYKKPMSSAAARRELAAQAGHQFDPDVVRAFLNITIGRLRLAVGPMAWLALMPFGAALERLASGSAALGATVAGTVGLLFAGGLIEAPTLASEAPSPPSAIGSEEPTSPDQTVGPTIGPSDGLTPTPDPGASPTDGPTDVSPTDPTATPTGATEDPAAVPASPVVLRLIYSSTPPIGTAVPAGSEIDVVVLVQNDTSDIATGSSLQMVSLAGGSIRSGSVAVNGGALGSGGDLAAGIQVGDIPSGGSVEVTLVIEVDAGAPPGTAVAPRLRAGSGGAFRDVSPGAYAVAGDVVVHLEGAANPAAGTPVAVDDVVTYSLTISNLAASDAPATGLTLTAPVPSGSEYVTGSASVDGSPVTGSAPFAAGYELGDLSPGSSHAVEFQVRVLSGSEIVRLVVHLDADPPSGRLGIAIDHPRTSAAAVVALFGVTGVVSRRRSTASKSA